MEENMPHSVADPRGGGGGGGGGVRGFTPQRLFFFFVACQYMKIPADLHPKHLAPDWS